MYFERETISPWLTKNTRSGKDMPKSKITFLFFSHICLLKWMIKAKGRYILSKKNVMYCVCVVQFTRAWITTKKTNKKASRRIQYKNRGNYVVSSTHLFLLQTFTSPTSHFFLFTMRLLSNTQNCAFYILASFFSAAVKNRSFYLCSFRLYFALCVSLGWTFFLQYLP